MRDANSGDPTWHDILPDPFVTAILGRRGSGKSALGHHLLEEFGNPDTGRDAYIMGFPQNRRSLLPDWLRILPVGQPFDSWPQDSITLVNEAHHIAHARESMSAENLELDSLITISRQRDASIIFDTQYARRLDVSASMGANALIFRYPSMMAEDFERSQMRKLVREAKDALDKYVTEHQTEDYTFRDESPELMRHAYVVGERFRGEYPHEVPLPDYWDEKISKAYGEGKVSGDMADMSDVRVRGADEIDEMIASVGVDEDADMEIGVEVEASQGREFINRMIESGNRVMSNPFSNAVVELIGPREMKDELEAVVDRWDLDPAGHGIMAQEPSFGEERPEIAETLVSFQFFLSEGQSEDLTDSGYALNNIFEDLEDEPVIASKSPRVRASLAPFE